MVLRTAVGKEGGGVGQVRGTKEPGAELLMPGINEQACVGPAATSITTGRNVTGRLE